MKNRKTLKIIIWIVVILLIGGILFVVNGFVGNPISGKIADNEIKKYVDKKYASLDLEVEKSRYNFKDGSYGALAKSKNSIDTHFYIYYSNGKIKYDEYETSVLDMFNTLQRLSEEYSEVARSLIENELGYENTTMVMYNNGEHDDDSLKLDMKFDKSLPIDSEVLIRIDLTDNSMENISRILTDSHGVFVKNNCNFSKYGFFSEVDNSIVMIDNVTPKDIENGNLQSLLQNAKDNEGSSKISVFIKEDNK